MLHNTACLEPLRDNLIYPPKRGDYVYFENLPVYEAGSLFPNAAWAADGAMLAYARYGKVRMRDEEFREILAGAGFTSVSSFGDCFSDGACTARGYFAANEEWALLAFRGTEADNGNDIEADADARFVADRGTQVHRGFHGYLQTIWWYIERVIANYRMDHPKQDICITGHSLGGALATLAFARLHDEATCLITFGCPRVGDGTLCAAVAAVAGKARCYRVVDNSDVVTHVPPPIMYYAYDHPAIPVLWFDATGALIHQPEGELGDWRDIARVALGSVHGHLFESVADQLPLPLADHSPVRYCHWTDRAMRKRMGDL